ncbi:MAG: S-formylglutathione hydrolase [Pseudomonadota bacterium]|nr:MAG: S-formylglutathione hydrolase [Pseudomonadota bacterium]
MSGIVETVSEQRCFGGVQGFYRHESTTTGGPMRFSVFVPPDTSSPRPALYYLAGLTCTEETFPIKAGAQRMAAALGLVLVACDTSPRAMRYLGDDASWDFGQGAGFYVDATEEPWRQSYRMDSYVTRELPALIERHFPVQPGVRGIFGHSMGGHGALVLALRNPELYRSVSAFAPIVAPSQVPWGQKAFTGYLGRDRAAWAAYDASELVRARPLPFEVLVDIGTADKFLDVQLRPELFEQACAESGQKLALRRHAGYDHSYYFIQTFIDDHLAHHARALCG